MQVLSEYYVTVTRKLRPGLSREDAWDDVTALLVWRPQSTDAALVRRGREIEQRHGLSWWDSLVVAAAQLQGCGLLLTEDLQDGALYGNVRAGNPFNIAVGESAAAYPVRPVVSRQTPTRGRPLGSSRISTMTR